MAANMPIIEVKFYSLRCDYCGRECPCSHDSAQEALREHDDWWCDKEDHVWCPDMSAHFREAKDKWDEWFKSSRHRRKWHLLAKPSPGGYYY
jgi:hypothetical protein